jgi:hypothetical protein
MALENYDLLDPGALLADVARLTTLTAGRSLLALVAAPTTTQQVLRVETLPVDCTSPLPDDLSQMLRHAVVGFDLPRSAYPWKYSVVTIIVRPGFAVIGRTERNWYLGWRYSNHLQPTFSGDLIVVTDHGWVDMATRWAGHNPRMVS